MAHPDSSENHRSRSAGAWALVIPILLIIAAGAAFLDANIGIQANRYLDAGMRGLAAIELQDGIYAGVSRALLLGAGCLLFVVLSG